MVGNIIFDCSLWKRWKLQPGSSHHWTKLSDTWASASALRRASWFYPHDGACIMWLVHQWGPDDGALGALRGNWELVCTGVSAVGGRISFCSVSSKDHPQMARNHLLSTKGIRGYSSSLPRPSSLGLFWLAWPALNSCSVASGLVLPLIFSVVFAFVSPALRIFSFLQDSPWRVPPAFLLCTQVTSPPSSVLIEHSFLFLVIFPIYSSRWIL